MNRRRVVLAVIATLALSACGGSADASEQTSGQDVTVRMFDNRYEYTEIRIPVGGTVNFLGAGRNPHNTVAADGAWSTEEVTGTLEQFEGDDAVVTFTEAGEYPFYCTFHGNAEGAGMAGTVIVGGNGA